MHQTSRSRGRPPVAEPRKSGARVEVLLTDEELARLDALRGTTPRAVYLRELLARAEAHVVILAQPPGTHERIADLERRLHDAEQELAALDDRNAG